MKGKSGDDRMAVAREGGNQITGGMGMKRIVLATLLVMLALLVLAACGIIELTEPEAEPEAAVNEVEDSGTHEEKAEERMPLEVTLEMAPGGEGEKPVFTFDTNLPDGTTMEINIVTDDDLEYLYQEELTVKGGSASTDAVTNEGEPLKGRYYVNVTVEPYYQTEAVKEIIGENGEYMKGDCVEPIGEYTIVAQSFDYVVPAKDEEIIEKLKEQLTGGFGNDYAIQQEGKAIIVDVWQDGLAQIAGQARAGIKEAAESWRDISKTTLRSAIRMQEEVLDANGRGDLTVAVRILNDENHDYTLLIATKDGYMQDAVSGLDLLAG